MAKHKHAELIKAWADGAEIEHYSSSKEGWRRATTPSWFETKEYRIKPIKPKYKEGDYVITDRCYVCKIVAVKVIDNASTDDKVEYTVWREATHDTLFIRESAITHLCVPVED